MPFSLPPLSLSSGASGGLDTSGSSFDWGGGSWSVNVSGSGNSAQSASSSAGIKPWMYVAAGVLVYLLWNK